MFCKVTVLLLAFGLSLADQSANGTCHFDGKTYQAGDTITIGSCLASMKCLAQETYGDLKHLHGDCSNPKRDVDGQTGCLFDGHVYAKGDKIIIEPCLAEMTCLGSNLYSEVATLGGVCPKQTRDVDGQTGCLFDGHVYAKGDKIIIQPCLAELTCLGNNAYSEVTSLGGQCPKQTRDVDGQTGCLFDGHVYAKGDKIIIQPCLAEMTCEGNNAYSDVTSLGGQCPKQTRDVDGQTGCLFDGHVYAKGDKIIIQPCLAEMTCEGNNAYSDVTSLGGQCPKQTRDVDGQTGCLFDGHVYAKGDKIIIQPCLAEMTCEGNNAYSDIVQLGGQCPKQTRDVNGMTGCLFDGRVYAKGDKIIIPPCLAELTCEGNNAYSDITALGGECPKQTRDVDGQTGCLFDGHVYAKGDKIIIQPCLAELTCEGNNNYSEITELGGQC